MSLCKRAYTRGEQLADRWLHAIALVAAAAAALMLIGLTLRQGDPLLAVSTTLYGLGLVGMVLGSTLCNHDLTDHHSPRARTVQRLDHSAILFLIAATYTPFTVHLIGGPWGWGLLTFVWAVALAGIAITLVRRQPLKPAAAVALYLLLGWSILPGLDPLLSAISLAGLILLVAGGLLYSSGVLFYLWYRLPYHNVIWHAFVIAAAACHYAAVLAAVVLPATGSDTVT